jgi:photosystem II stability/assembly factor-like uncharacterized protein
MHPTGPDTYILYAASVNGGVWRADNFADTLLAGLPEPPIQWTPVSDQAPTLSVASLAVDPLDNTGNTVWAGTGSFSSSRKGGRALGLLKTTNGRDALPLWITLGDQAPQAADISLTGQRITSVVPTTLMDPRTGQQIILVAAFDGRGILQSTDGGQTFHAVRNVTEGGALSGCAVSLVADPNSPRTFYAAIRATEADSLFQSVGGVFRSPDGGSTWTRIDNGITQVTTAINLQLGVFDNSAGSIPGAGPTILYVSEAFKINGNHPLVGLFRAAHPTDNQPDWDTLFFSTDPGTNVPDGPRFPSSFDFPFSAMVVNPGDGNNLYLGGDFAWLYQVQVVMQPGRPITTVWTESVKADWDHRSLTFVNQNVLVLTGDPGIFAMPHPKDLNPWVSLNATLSVTEFYAVAYDPTAGFICGGAQDVGTAVQNITGGWNQLPKGGDDGGLALVGSDGVYYYEDDGTFRRNRNGDVSTPAAIPEVHGPEGKGIAVNIGNPMELLVNGLNKLFVSPDQGDSVRDITPPTLTGNITALAFAADVPGVAYIGTDGGQLFVREPGQDVPLPVLDYPGHGFPVNDIAVDRGDSARVAILSADGAIYFRAGGGLNWANIRGNIDEVLSFERTIELVSIGPDIVIVVGGDPNPGMAGVVRTINPATFGPNPTVVWSQFGTGLAHAIVSDLHFEPSVTLRNGKPGGDLLLAATLGRGAWIVPPAGPNDLTLVPNCVSETENAAVQTLAEFSLRLGRTHVLPPRPGTTALTPLRVVDQLPEPGSQVNVGSTVDLTLQKYLFRRPHP